MTNKPQTTKYHKVGCPCGSEIMSKAKLTGEMLMDAGWHMSGGKWYCDDCPTPRDERGTGEYGL